MIDSFKAKIYYSFFAFVNSEKETTNVKYSRIK